jgi:hypothetical protein
MLLERKKEREREKEGKVAGSSNAFQKSRGKDTSMYFSVTTATQGKASSYFCRGTGTAGKQPATAMRFSDTSRKIFTAVPMNFLPTIT